MRRSKALQIIVEMWQIDHAERRLERFLDIQSTVGDPPAAAYIGEGAPKAKERERPKLGI